MRQINWAFWIAGQAGVIPYGEGAPGTAKTQSTAALAKLVNRRFLPVCLDTMIPEDLRGFPVVSEIHLDGVGHKVMQQVLDEQFLLARLVPSVMLIDELTCVGNTMQAAALSWMCNPPPTCWVYSAGNPVDMAAAGTPLADAMINRLCVLDWEVDTESWAEGMLNSGGFEFPVSNIPIITDDWKENVPFYSEQINTFVNTTNNQLSRPEYLIKPPKEESQRGRPFGSPRSWTRLAWLLGASDSVGGNHKTRRALACGMVGDGIGQEFLDFLKVEGLMTPEEILANPKDVNVPRQCNMAISYIGAVIRRVREVCTPERWEAARIFLSACHHDLPEPAQAFKGKLWKLKPAGHQPEYSEYFSDMESERVEDLTDTPSTGF
jgi:hypothetical protein